MLFSLPLFFHQYLTSLSLSIIGVITGVQTLKKNREIRGRGKDKCVDKKPFFYEGNFFGTSAFLSLLPRP
jgi:hypothetical protein